MSEESNDTKVRLSAIFRHVVSADAGVQDVFLRALDSEDSTRSSLHDLCDYDAFKDGFLLRPTLESMLVTHIFFPLPFPDLFVVQFCHAPR